jgi:hypothetical protein
MAAPACISRGERGEHRRRPAGEVLLHQRRADEVAYPHTEQRYGGLRGTAVWSEMPALLTNTSTSARWHVWRTTPVLQTYRW